MSYTANLKRLTEQPYACLQTYISKFEEFLKITPRNIIAPHDAIRIFLQRLPESLRLELTLQHCTDINEVVSRARFITNNRTCFLGQELPMQSLRGFHSAKTVNYSNRGSQKIAPKNSTPPTIRKDNNKFCCYHKTRTHSDEDCRHQQQKKDIRNREHHVDIAIPIPHTENKSTSDIQSYNSFHVAANFTHPSQLPPLVSSVTNTETSDFLWTTASAATVPVTIDEIPITAILDTGCAGVTLSSKVLEKIKQAPEVVQTTAINTAERNITTNLGFRRFTFQFGNEIIHCPAIILPSDSYDMLLKLLYSFL